MRIFTFKGLLLTTVFMLLGCLSIQAADDGLITEQITVNLDEAGTLEEKIKPEIRSKITNLKIVGEVNGTDWKLIRNIAGTGYGSIGKLSVLDLSEAKIVEGGDSYYNDVYIGEFYTSNDCVGGYAFAYCNSLTSIDLPSTITKIDYRTVIYVPKGTAEDYYMVLKESFPVDRNQIVEFDATGIDKVTISTDTKEVSRYSVNGQRLSAPTKGLNIVKYSDGSVKKVAVQ